MTSLHLHLWPRQSLVLKHRNDLGPDDLECRGAKPAIPRKSLWHAYHFELKTIKAQKAQEETDLPPPTA